MPESIQNFIEGQDICPEMYICMCKSNTLHIVSPCPLVSGFGGMLAKENLKNGRI